jgi:hypothetical protein
VSLISCADTNVVNYTGKLEGRLIVGATVHLGNGDYLENALLGVQDGMVSVLEENSSQKLDLNKFQVEKLGPDYHIYPFKKAEAANEGMVLTRANEESINISILNNQVDRYISLGSQAQLLVCYGRIEDGKQFRVDYVVMGNEKVKILRPGEYSSSGALD